MVVRLLKCYGEKCLKDNIKHPKENLVELGGKRYCQTCLIEHQKNKAERQKLYNYLCEMFEISVPTGHMMKQIKNFKEEYGISYREQLLTANYVFERTDLNPDPRYGVAFIGAYHQAMLAELDDMLEQREKIRNIEPDEVHVVNIQEGRSENQKEIKAIDMNDLF